MDKRSKPGECACVMCGAEITNQPWVALNRWSIGTGTNRGRYEYRENGSYVYAADEPIRDSTVLCWPSCFQSYIEVSMAEVDIGAERMS